MKKYTYNPTTGRYETQPRRRSSGELRQRAERKAERAELAAKGLLVAQPSTFRCFISRLTKEAVFESPNRQVDLNDVMCCSSIEVPAEHSKNRLVVSSENMEAFAAELEAKGWLRVS